VSVYVELYDTPRPGESAPAIVAPPCLCMPGASPHRCRFIVVASKRTGESRTASVCATALAAEVERLKRWERGESDAAASGGGDAS
jgi:hypothetical protein